jgi:DNA-binding MarR family transcriptional regulator
MKNIETVDTAGRYAYGGLDRVMHEKARLGILTSLVTHRQGLRFNELKTLCALTDGNLNRHLQPLQEAGLIDLNKGGAGRRQSTIVRITDLGRRRFADYISVLESVVVDAVQQAQPSGRKLRPSVKPA